jgi:hypothetical protein
VPVSALPAGFIFGENRSDMSIGNGVPTLDFTSLIGANYQLRGGANSEYRSGAGLSSERMAPEELLPAENESLLDVLVSRSKVTTVPLAANARVTHSA